MARKGRSPGHSPEIPDDINSRLAEVAAELAAEAWFKEPSAAERASVPVTLVPGRPDLGAARQRQLRPLLAVAIVIAMLFAAGAGFRQLLQRGSPVPSSSARPAPASRASPAPFTAADPFARTPAQNYGDGAKGIVLPVAQAVGSYRAAQVAAAYQSVRRLLVAAELDPQTLYGGSPTAFGNLLTPQQRTWFYDNLPTGVRTGRGLVTGTSRVWVTAFFPGSTELVGKIIKVSGSAMTASVVEYNGHRVLSVFANYLFVYPVEAPADPASRVRVVEHVEESVYFWTRDDPGGPLEAWLANVTVARAGASCGQADGYVHPVFAQADEPSQPTIAANPYDLTAAPANSGSCAMSSGG